MAIRYARNGATGEAEHRDAPIRNNVATDTSICHPPGIVI